MEEKSYSRFAAGVVVTGKGSPLRLAIRATLVISKKVKSTAVKNLYLSKEFAPGIAAALQGLIGITEELPSLQNIFVEELGPSGPFQENIRQFVTTRQRSDHPIAISFWYKCPSMKPVIFTDLFPASEW